MKITKTVLGTLEKCYALSPLTVGGRDCLLVAAEKHAPCLRFDLEGNLLDTVWTEPGGVMTMVPVKDGLFLATHQFYSPNDSAQAKLVSARYLDGRWEIRTVAELPFVHRFGLLERNGRRYLIACTLKSGHEYKDDWRSPGKVLAAELPENYDGEALSFTLLRDGMFRNHGYTKFTGGGTESGVISCQSGVYRFTPPAEPGGTWGVEQLLNEPCSDAVLLDLDGDGQPELFTMSPFHGDQIQIWHLEKGTYRSVYRYPVPTPFLHAICGGTLRGKPVIAAGNREGERDLMIFWWDGAKFRADVADHDRGPANCLLFSKDHEDYILAANRETNEIALYHMVSAPWEKDT